MQRLSARRILVVEDEALLAMWLEDTLSEAGAEVIGPVATIDEALATIAGDERLDAAVLDLNLAGQTSEAVAAALVARSVPYIVASGFNELVLPETRKGADAAVVKPYEPEDLVTKLAAIFAE